MAMTEEEAVAAVRDAIDGHAFGGAGARVVIEEYLTGPEAVSYTHLDVYKRQGSLHHAAGHRRADGNQRDGRHGQLAVHGADAQGNSGRVRGD